MIMISTTAVTAKPARLVIETPKLRQQAPWYNEPELKKAIAADLEKDELSTGKLMSEAEFKARFAKRLAELRAAA